MVIYIARERERENVPQKKLRANEVGWAGTSGRSQVRFPMRFYIDLILPDTNKNEYQESLLGRKGGRCVVLTTLPPFCAAWEHRPTGVLKTCQELHSDCFIPYKACQTRILYNFKSKCYINTCPVNKRHIFVGISVWQGTIPYTFLWTTFKLTPKSGKHSLAVPFQTLRAARTELWRSH